VGDDTLLAAGGYCHSTSYLLPCKPCYEKGQRDKEAGLVHPKGRNKAGKLLLKAREVEQGGRAGEQ
jgi:hypothetical protein